MDSKWVILSALVLSALGALFYNLLPMFLGVAQDYRELDNKSISLLSSNTYFISKFAQTFIYLVIPISFIPLLAIWQAARDGKMDAKIILAGTLVLFAEIGRASCRERV